LFACVLGAIFGLAAYLDHRRSRHSSAAESTWHSRSSDIAN
jgi:hypothetical protein